MHTPKVVLPFLIVLSVLTGCATQPKTSIEFLDRASDLSSNPSNLEQEWKVLCEEFKKSEFCSLLAREYRAAGKIEASKTISENHCKAGEAESCIELGKTLYSEGLYGEADPYLKSACLGSNPESCEWAGLVAAGLKDHTRALNHYRRGCSAGMESACYQLGRSLRSKGRGGEATTPLRKACDSGVAGACTELAIVLWQSGKAEAGLKLFQADCERKVHRACRWLPLLERKLAPLSPSIKPIEELLEKDCKKNDQKDACYDLAVLQFLRNGGRNLALHAWRENCKVSHPMSCWEVHLEESFESGISAHDKDSKEFCDKGVLIACYYEAATELLRGNSKAAYASAKTLCEKGEPWSCQLASQNPLLRDEERDPLLKKACELGLKDSCPGAGVADMEITVGSAVSTSESLSLQCDSGVNGDACAWMGYESQKTDPSTSLSYYQKACKLRSVYGCRLLREFKN